MPYAVDVPPITDVPSERAALGSILHRPDLLPDVFTVAGPETFWLPQHGLLAGVLLEMHRDGKPIDPQTVLDACKRAGILSQVDGVMLANLLERAFVPSNAVEYAKAVAESYRARRVSEACQRAFQQVNGVGVDDAVLTLAGAVDDYSTVATAKESMDLHDFLKLPSEHDWLIDGFLERSDRVILTGLEGGGKSWAMAQIAMTAAAGLHPFAHHRTKPVRVLFMDFENPQRLVGRRMARLHRLVQSAGGSVEAGFLRVESRFQGVDLTKPEGAAWFVSTVVANHPDLLLIGSLYKMHETNINDELAARQVASVIEEASSKSRCAVIIEAHAPHGGPGVRDLRPAGSSVFKRWPGMGFGLRPVGDSDAFEVVSWRGLRDDRTWPAYLRNGSPSWPWVEHAEARWSA